MPPTGVAIRVENQSVAMGCELTADACHLVMVLPMPGHTPPLRTVRISEPLPSISAVYARIVYLRRRLQAANN